MGGAGSEGVETKFHVFIFCFKPVADRPFTLSPNWMIFQKRG